MNNVKKLLLATALGSITSLAWAQSLEVTITPVSQSFDKNSDVKVQLTVTNTSDESVKILSWYLAPNKKLQNNAFEVSVDGKSVMYTGPVVKRSVPTDKDYISLNVGDSISQTVELSAFYDMTQSGTYRVQYDVNAAGLMKSTAKLKTQAKTDELQKLKSDDVSFWVEGVDLKESRAALNQLSTATQAAGEFSLDYVGNCSNSQKSAISNAIGAAQEIGYDAANHLYDYWYKGSESARYNTWFGTYTEDRYRTVTDHFYNIYDALTQNTVTMDCFCEADLTDAYAYVYPNQPYHIHLCNAFWSAETKGTDSQSGTIIHEMSHFTVNGGTDDVVYGMNNARSLAYSSPDKAVNNADNHEYFAENPYNQ